MKQADVIYAAGLFDGEGCINAYGRKKCAARPSGVQALKASVSMTDREVVQWLADTFGGKVYDQGVRPGRKRMYRWDRSNGDAVDFLKKIYPYMRVKKTEALYALSWPTNVQGKHLSEAQKDLRQELTDALHDAK